MELSGQDVAPQVTGGLFPPPPHPAEFAHLVSAPGTGAPAPAAAADGGLMRSVHCCFRRALRALQHMPQLNQAGGVSFVDRLGCLFSCASQPPPERYKELLSIQARVRYRFTCSAAAAPAHASAQRRQAAAAAATWHMRSEWRSSCRSGLQQGRSVGAPLNFFFFLHLGAPCRLQVIATVNAALCERHLAKCPPSQELNEQCDQARAPYPCPAASPSATLRSSPLCCRRQHTGVVRVPIMHSHAASVGVTPA